MRQRIETNGFRDENTKLRTRLAIVETELFRKDKIIDDLFGNNDVTFLAKRLPESHLTSNLRRKVKEL
jgi:hypothetical protein